MDCMLYCYRSTFTCSFAIIIIGGPVVTGPSWVIPMIPMIPSSVPQPHRSRLCACRDIVLSAFTDPTGLTPGAMARLRFQRIAPSTRAPLALTVTFCACPGMPETIERVLGSGHRLGAPVRIGGDGLGWDGMGGMNAGGEGTAALPPWNA